MLTALVVAVLAVACVIIAYYIPTDSGDRLVSVVIEPGDDFRKIGNLLLNEKIVHFRTILLAAARWRGIDRKLIPGRYDFLGKNSCKSVLDKLEGGDFVSIKVTIYEGATIWAVASILAEPMQVDSAEIVRLNSDSAFLQSLGVPCLEGYLFPETYFFPWGTNAPKMLSEMVTMYRLQTADIWPETIHNRLSREQIVVLASIVEAEALFNEEKPQIASVYHNRIERNMKLDADPTVIYGLGGLKRPLSRRDLRQETAYNTYLRKGLPPTAINSPGLRAIKAALHPAETDFLYFVADGSGAHRYARTNAEHNRNRQAIRRENGEL